MEKIFFQSQVNCDINPSEVIGIENSVLAIKKSVSFNFHIGSLSAVSDDPENRNRLLISINSLMSSELEISDDLDHYVPLESQSGKDVLTYLISRGIDPINILIVPIL